MYLRAIHSTYHLPTLYDFIKSHPLGLLTTYLPIDAFVPIQSSHIPWVLDPAESSEQDASVRAQKTEPLGTLRGHLARANPQAKAIIAAAGQSDGKITLPDEVLVMFTGPVQHYVTPKFYTETKPATGKVVPTWNYEAVEVYGRITVYPKSAGNDFLSSAIADLTKQSERAMGYGDESWEVEDAPDKFISILKNAIVGVSIEITRIGGKFKMSQESKAGDRQGVIEGFLGIGQEQIAKSVARESDTDRS